MEFATGINSIQTAINLVKEMKTSKELMNDIEVKIKIVELNDVLLNVKDENLNYKSKAIELENRVKELEKKLNQKNSIIFEEPFYWKELNSGKKEGPFCQKCYDFEGKLSRLISSPKKEKGTHHCCVCDSWHGKKIESQQQIENTFNSVFGKRRSL